MKSLKILLLLLLLVSTVSAQINIRTPENQVSEDNSFINILSNVVSAVTGGNVTSIASGDGCILVNQPTGDVVLTFNTSCASSGGNFFFANFTASFNSNLTAVLPLENRTIVHCSNVTGNGLCPTSDAQFKNVTVQNISVSQFITGKDIILRNTGTAIFPETTFNVGTVSVGGGLVSLAILRMTGGAGLTVGAIEDGLYILPSVASTSPRILLSRVTDAQDVWVFENNNNTGALQIFRQNPFAGGTIDSIVNISNYNVTYNHQSYDITGSTSLDTTYTNTQGKVIKIDVTFESSVTTRNDVALVYGYENGNRFAGEGIGNYNVLEDTGESQLEVHHFSIDVQAGELWSLNSTLVGSGSVQLFEVEMTIE